MIARRRCRHVHRALIGAMCLALAAPAAAAAARPANAATDGGGGLGTEPVATVAGNGGAAVTTSGNGVTLSTSSTAMLRRTLTFTGTAPPGQTVQIEREGRATDWTWTRTARATADASGAFTASWATSQSGQFAVRASLVAPTPALATTAQATPALTVTVYRRAKATVYGPGLYGRKTACGARLTRTTIGVANRTLPCGSQVSILFRGHTLTVPVIDRGPYANHANWDLTMATASALRMDGTARIGTVVLPKATTSLRPTSVRRHRRR